MCLAIHARSHSEFFPEQIAHGGRIRIATPGGNLDGCQRRAAQVFLDLLQAVERHKARKRHAGEYPDCTVQVPRLFLEILRHFRRVVKPFFVEKRHKGVHDNGPAGAYSMVDRHHFAPTFFVLDQFRLEDTDVNLVDADLWDCYCHISFFFYKYSHFKTKEWLILSVLNQI